MVFSSLQAYLDPANWQQHPNHHQVGNNSGLNTNLLPTQPPPPPPPPPPSQPHGVSTNPGGSIRPGSMVERARLANIPMPEAALKCPRCDSTNTKFCYFNNYSLSQPRHFCKTCRRYWTRGGALRNVPVGGGCRRNKRSKGSSSKSPAANTDQQTSGGSTSNITSSSSSLITGDILGRATAHIPGLRFMSPGLNNMNNELVSGEIGLNYGGISASSLHGEAGNLNFHLGGGLGSSINNSSLLSVGSLEHQWRLQQVTQQFPFMSSLDKHSSLYPIEGASVEASGGLLSQVKPSNLISSGAAQLSSVKVEDNNNNNNQDQLNLSRHFLGAGSGTTDQYWTTMSGSAWTDLSGFSSSSTSSAL